MKVANLVLTSGFEPETSSLPMKCSTSELCEQDISNKSELCACVELERVAGIEPA